MKFKRGIGWLCILLLTLNIVSNIQIKNVQATTDNVNARGNILFKMENPVQDHELTGDFFIKGYALSTVGISKVEVYLDGVLNGTADYGIKRDDIGKKYNDVYPDAYNSGFTYKFKGASDGEHYLTIKAIDKDGNEQLTSASIIISNEKKLVMGKGQLTKNQMLQDIYSRCTRLTKKEMNEFVEYVIQEANIEGVDHDVAYALMMLETNYLNFGGDVKPDQNNFGGLGATGNGVPGLSFETVQIGVRAVVQHIKAYGSKENLVQALVDPRFKYVERGLAIYVEYLGIKENPEGKGWAAGKDYGKKIKSIINRVALYSTVFNNSYVRELNVDGNYLVGNKINITSNSSDNNNTLFKITVREKSTNNVIMVKEYSSERTSSFTPSKEGTYVIEVNVRHKSSSNSVDDTWTKEIYVDYVSSSITSVDITEEVFKNTPVTITVNADPKNNTLYRMWVKESGEWRVISDYSENNIATFTPKSAGTYAVQVDVKNKNSNKNYDDVWSKLIEVNELIDVKINEVNISGKHQVNSPINIEVDANLKKDTLYRIWIRENGNWRVISDYSEKNTATYTPKTAGTYAVQVDVKNKYSNNNYDDVWSALLDIKEADKLRIDKVNVLGKMEVNTPINIEVNTNVKENTLYRIWIRENGNWRVISDYSEKNTATYTPKTAGTYAVQVDVKNKYSNNNYDDVWSALLEVNNARPTINNVEIIGEHKVGNAITIKVNATPITDLLYRIWVKEDGNWRVISDYSEKNIAEFTPKKLGIYPIQVDVKFKNSTNIYDSVYSELIDINVPALSKIEDIQVIGEMKAEKPITISAKANPSNSTLYRIWVKENGVWKIISDFSKQNKVVYTPKSAGSYAIQIDVKNEYSLNTIDDVTSKLISIGKSDKKTIVIDAGHGGIDGGASATHGFTTFKEATIALQISLKLKSYLEIGGYNVHMTRTTDTYVELVDRAKFANNIMADLFISVHCNSFTSPSATGVEVLYTEKSMDSSVRDELISMGYEDPEINKQNRINQSKSLATIISKNLADSIGLVNRGAKSQNINVLRNTIMPAVLVECGFISNPNDILLLSLDSNQDTIARAITNTLVDVFK